MKSYFDPIYGQIELDSLTWELIHKCPELKRLRFIGMMNFKSLNMLPLTTISRLEHSIGLAYLSQIFSEHNDIKSLKNDLLVASLYHDVNCGSFGHSVEWAIDRHVDFKHENDAEWVESEERLDDLRGKPIFIEQDGLHRFKFQERYNLNFSRINNIIKGKDYYIINNTGIDLDNIDNVFRMGHYLGLNINKETPVRLATSLKYNKDYSNFIIHEDLSFLIEEWMNLRSDIYCKFIYSDEYMGYEYLIFKLISEYSTTLNDIEEVKNLFHFTDERLLWEFYDNKKENVVTSNIAKRLLLHQVPNCYGILRTKEYSFKEELVNTQVLQSLVNRIQSNLGEKGINLALNLHITTDNRKTNRKIEFFTNDSGKNITSTTLGSDEQFLVLAVLGDTDTNNIVVGHILNETIATLETEGYTGFSICRYKNKSPQQTLF